MIAPSDRRPSSASAPRRGFTLIELLVVIGIIMLLMGMSFAAFGIVRKAAMKTKTQDLMAKIAASCESFRTANGFYPATRDLKIAGATPWSTSAALTDAMQKLSTEPSKGDWEAITFGLFTDLNLAGDSWKLPVQDAWKTTFAYRPAKYYPYKAGATEVLDGETPPNRDTYQLWSAGPDGSFAPGKPNADGTTADNLGNWSKSN